jgi:hypothetical protein
MQQMPAAPPATRARTEPLARSKTQLNSLKWLAARRIIYDAVQRKKAFGTFPCRWHFFTCKQVTFGNYERAAWQGLGRQFPSIIDAALVPHCVKLRILVRCQRVMCSSKSPPTKAGARLVRLLRHNSAASHIHCDTLKTCKGSVLSRQSA